MRWGHSHLWWVALAVPLGIILIVYGHLIRRSLIARAGHIPMVRKLLETFSPERRLFKQLLLMLGLTLVVITALRPQFGRRPETLRRAGIDVVVAFDISKSMLARDVHPSRIDGARTQLKQLITLVRGHRIALVPFAGAAFVQSPLTSDKSAVRLYLESLDPKNMPIGGTNLAMAIDESVRLLTGEGDRAEQSGRSRVVLLITDGETTSEAIKKAAQESARKASEAGVRIYAIAVGTRLGEPIPLLDNQGNHMGYQKGSDKKPIYSKLDMELLEELATLADPERPGAQHVFLFDGKSPVAPALANALDKLQKSVLETTVRHKHGEKFQFALLPAFLLLLLELLLGERRRRRVEVTE